MSSSSDTIDTQRLVAARLDREQSLSVFRSLLAALSRPGRIVQMDIRSDLDDRPHVVPAALWPVLALADLDQRVVVLDAAPWAGVVAGATGAIVVDDIAAADVVVALRPPTTDELDRVRVGTHAAPEAGARVFVACRELHADPGTHDGDASAVTTFAVHGPGASRGRRVGVVGLGDDVVAGIRRATLDFPAGFDTWLVDDRGAVVGLPRSVEIV